MSLILEALKKLERERQVPERGFLVMAPAEWPRSRPRRAAVVGAAFSLLLVAAGGAAWIWLRPVPAAPASTQQTTPTSPPFPAAGSRPPAPLPPTATRSVEPLPVSPPKTEAAPEPRTVTARPPLALQAISRRDGRPVAIIDDRLVHEGDHYDGIVILKIGDSEVELEVEGQRRVLRF